MNEIKPKMLVKPEMPVKPKILGIDIETYSSAPLPKCGVYNSLLEGGWRMQEIDGMDMPGFLRIRAWNAKRERKKKEPRRAYIDEVWGNLKP